MAGRPHNAGVEGSSPSLSTNRSLSGCDRLILAGSGIACPVQPHGGGPGEIVTTDSAAGSRAEVLVHAGLLDQPAGVGANSLTPVRMSGGVETAADEMVDDRPHRTTPVADRIESRVVVIQVGSEVLRRRRNPLKLLE